MPNKNQRRQTIAIDFDGTICKFPKFISPSKIPYGPMEGAKEALDAIHEYFRVVVFSVRASTPEGAKAIATWMDENKIPFDSITSEKPHASLYIDDNALRFEGDWKATLQQITEIKHYSKK